jgi:hypothetical protein
MTRRASPFCTAEWIIVTKAEKGPPLYEKYLFIDGQEGMVIVINRQGHFIDD